VGGGGAGVRASVRSCNFRPVLTRYITMVN
jgi:hypothetical protein